MAKFNFVLNKKPSKNGRYAIFLRVTIDKEKASLFSGVEVKNPDHFLRGDKRKSSDSWVHSYEPGYKVMNAKLTDLRDTAKKIYEDLVKIQKVVTPGMVIEQMKPRKADRNTDSFIFFVENKINLIKNNALMKNTKTGGKYGYRTAIKYNDFLNKLKGFLKENGKKDLLFVELNRRTIADFETYLLRKGNEVEKDKMLNSNTITKEMKVFRALLNMVIREEKFEAGKSPFIGNKYAETKPQKERLNLAEIRLLEALSLESGSLIWNCRNAFLFSLYCAGIRAGDLLQLRWGNITTDGRLHYQMEKSDKYEDMVLIKQAQNILDLYRRPGMKASDYIFPFLKDCKPYASALTKGEKETLAPDLNRRRLGDISSCNAIINMNLKKIAEMAGIEKKVTMHISRHSFAKIAKDLGIDNLHLMKLMGHSSLKVTEIYMGNFDTKKTDEAMQQISSSVDQPTHQGPETDKSKLLAMIEGMDAHQIASLLAAAQGKE